MKVIELVLVAYFVFANTGATPPEPFDLAEDVQALVDQLKSLTNAAVLTGTINIQDLVDTSLLNRDNTYAAMEATLDESWLQVWLKVLQIRELAVGYNIAVCLQYREDVILRLPQRCRNDTDACLIPWTENLNVIRSDNVAKIGAVNDEAEAIAKQVEDCNGELLCLSPLVETIELNQVELPQRVQIEVQNTAEAVAEIDVEIKACTDAALTYMVEIGEMCVVGIQECVDKIIG